MLLNIPQCPGHPTMENDQAPNVSSAEAETPAFESEVQTATRPCHTCHPSPVLLKVRGFLGMRSLCLACSLPNPQPLGQRLAPS